MKCLRCGYCCLHYIVAIIVDPGLGPVKGNVRGINCAKEYCPHLCTGEPGKFRCAVHDEPWFPDSPCGEFGQVENSPDTLCRMGAFIMSDPKNMELMRDVTSTRTGDLL